MTTYPLLIPGIVPKIEQKLKTLGLTAQESPMDFVIRKAGKKHRYSSVCQDRQGKKIMFYGVLMNKPFEIERTKTEVKIAQYFQKHPLKIIPKYYQGKIENGWAWLTREALIDLPIETLGKIETLKRKLTPPELNQMVQGVWEITQIPTKNFTFLKKFDSETYLVIPQKAFVEKILSLKDSTALQSFIANNQKLLKNENRYFTHGDLQIGNIIAYKNIVKIIDLESAHINNFAFDIAFLTTRMWQNKKERALLIKKFYALLPQNKKEIFKTLFRIDTAYIAFYTYTSRPREYTASKIKQRRAFMKWLLMACLKSFEELTNLS